jgi:hypothetical protein
MSYGPFRAVLRAQARYLAPVVALATVATALLPLLTVQGLPWTEDLYVDRIGFLLRQSTAFSPFYPAVAVALGALFAGANWLPDATGRWVYAFTLPISRPRLALLRLGAGAILMLPALASLWIVGMIAGKVAGLPPVIQTHPGALTLRFAAATMVVYACASLLTLLGRKVWYLAAALAVLLIFNGFGLGLFTGLMDALFLHPLSPFHALAGYWLFLDV